jgi:hypothetical protein
VKRTLLLATLAAIPIALQSSCTEVDLDVSSRRPGPPAPECGDCDGVGENGCETNLSTDPLHCGACGKSCLGAACIAGHCGIELLSRVEGALEFALSDDHIYTGRISQFLENELVRMSHDGLDLQPMFDANDLYLAHFGVTGGRVFWATNNAIVQSMPTAPSDAGPSSVFTFSAAIDATAFTLANGSLYWIGTNGLQRVSDTGGASVLLAATACALPSAPVLAAEYVYWTCSGSLSQSDGVVARAPAAGGTVEVLAAGEETPKLPLVTDTHVYWSAGSGATGQLRRRSTTAPDVSSVWTDGRPAGSVLVGNRLFFTLVDGRLIEANPDGSEPVVRADIRANPCAPSEPSCGAPNFYTLRARPEALYWIDIRSPTYFYRLVP